MSTVSGDARALQRRPQDRYDTVEQMSAEFRDALDKIQRRSPAPAVAAPRVTHMVVLPFRVPTDAPNWESAMALQDTVCAEICVGVDTVADRS